MAKLTTCKTCGGQVAKSAKACPHCGAPVRQSSLGALVGAILLIGGALLLIKGISGLRMEPQQVTPSSVSTQASASPTAKPAPTPAKVYTVGDTLELKGVQTTLIAVRNDAGSQYNRPAEGNTFLIFEIEIVNNSKEDIAVSSLLSFSVYVDDYAQQISLEGILTDGGRQLDGTVSPGKKSRGIMAVEAPKDWQTAELQFTPDVWSGGTFVFTADRSQAS